MLKTQIAAITDFSTGQDTRTPILALPLTSSPNMRNWHCAGTKNKLVKRGGYTAVNSSDVPTDTLDVFYPPGYQSFDHTWRDTAANTNISQGFKPNTSNTVTKVRLWLKKTGAPTGNITISIETDSGGVPSGTSVSNGDSSNVDVTTLATTYGWIVFKFATNPTLTAGTQYHIVLKSSFSISNSAYVNWGADNYDLIYPNGVMSHYDGTTWTTEINYNACFEVYIINGLLGNVNSALFDFSSKSQLIGVFGTSLYGMNKNASGTPNGTWNPLDVSTVWDSYTVLMLHGDGTDDSTTITDEIGHTMTANGNAEIDTGVKEFGTGSIQFDGTNSYVTAPNGTVGPGTSTWYMGSDDFTIDFWVYIATLPSLNASYSIIGQWESVNARWGVDFNNIAGVYSWTIVFNNGSGQQVLTATTTISATTWYHIAVVRYGNNFMIFQNGVQIGATEAINDYLPQLGTSLLYIGVRNNGPDQFFNGNIDELRFSIGIARWTANFTPPSAAYSGASGALTSSRFWTFADWQSGTALINTDIGLYSFDGVSGDMVNAVSGSPIGKFMIIWNNYCMIFGLRGSANGYQYSALQDYTTWPNGNLFADAFDTNDGDVVTGVRILNGKLYVFKRYSIFRITYLGSNPTFQINQILGTGCPCHYVIKEVDLGGTIGSVLIFLTTDKKLAIFDGYNIQIINQNLTEKTNDLFEDSDDQPIAFSDMNYNYIDLFHAVAKTDTSEYILYCVLGNDTQVNYSFVYDWVTGGIFPYDNQIFASSLYAISTDKEETLYTGGYDGIMFQPESGNSDNGDAINAYWVSGKIKPQSSGLLTKMLWLFLYIKQVFSASPLTMNFQFRSDWNVSWQPVQTFNYNRDDEFASGATINFDIGTIENMFQVKIQDNSTQPAGTLYGIDLFGTQLGTEVEDSAVS